MGFIKFLLRHVYAAAAAVISGVLVVTSLASDAQSFLGSGYPSGVLVAVGAAVFMASLVWMQYQLEERLTAAFKVTRGAENTPILDPLQEKLLGLVVGYLKQFGVKKLIILKTGTLYFDDDKERGAGVDLARDMYGSSTKETQKALEELCEDMPPEYLRLIPNARWGGPMEVMIPDAGHRYLRTYNL